MHLCKIKGILNINISTLLIINVIIHILILIHLNIQNKTFIIQVCNRIILKFYNLIESHILITEI